MRAKRVDNFAKKSAQLSSISSNYGVAGGRSGRQGGGERGWGVLEQCKRTLLSTAVAAGQEDGHIEVRADHDLRYKRGSIYEFESEAMTMLSKEKDSK